MKKYIPSEIELKWQKKWVEEGLYASDPTKPNKYYVLAEFAYTSGDVHIGHWFTFAGADIYARFKKLQGYNVFFPAGFDAFGLPAENAAIKRGIHPKVWTMSNIERMKEQFARMGGCFTFDHEVITCLPEYYKWNQWIFLRMLEQGLAYKGKYLSNWCHNCQTVLANEAIEAGSCWRCGEQVEQKEIEQWFFKITDYADRLLWSDPPAGGYAVDWPKSLKDAQNNWIGKSEGILIKFENLEVFTTRPDTLFGVTFIVISPEHQLLNELTKPQYKKDVEGYIAEAKTKSELERKENKEKTGVFTGSYVKNPVTGEKIPIWVADYVLPGYGTGAIMAVPAHDQRDFEFAKKYDLEIRQVVLPTSEVKEIRSHLRGVESAYEGEGALINSGEYDGLSSNRAKENITKYLEEHQLGQKQVQYHLRDWSISRQRYWGTPIPVIYCGKCGIVPVPEKDLPVELPEDVDYAPKGKAPLESNKEWLNTKCPKCKGEARRDPETMDTFVDSSWYFFRYLDPKYDSAPFNKELAQKNMPVDIYFGGAEHNLGHTLYSRFFTKFFHDLGMTDLEEYAIRRINHGIVLGPDGQKMSKSKGNVVNPDEEVKKYGADAVRIHVAFFMPYEGSSGPWVSERIWGPYRFLERIWNLFDKIGDDKPSKNDLIAVNQTIKKVGEDIEGIRFNTAAAALMEWLNYLSRKEKVGLEEYKTLLLLLAPFAPHMTEELWQLVRGSQFTVSSSKNNERITDNELTNNWSIHQQSWPVFDKKYLEDEEIIIAVQVNGKLRDQLLIQKDIAKNKEVIEKMAKELPKIQKYLADKNIKKTVYIPVKIINFVVDKN